MKILRLSLSPSINRDDDDTANYTYIYMYTTRRDSSIASSLGWKGFEALLAIIQVDRIYIFWIFNCNQVWIVHFLLFVPRVLSFGIDEGIPTGAHGKSFFQIIITAHSQHTHTHIHTQQPPSSPTTTELTFYPYFLHTILSPKTSSSRSPLSTHPKTHPVPATLSLSHYRWYWINDRYTWCFEVVVLAQNLQIPSSFHIHILYKYTHTPLFHLSLTSHLSIFQTLFPVW